MIAFCRLSDVAAAAGVAVSTVSNVLSCLQKVTTETRVRILAAIDRLGHLRNEQANELSKGAR
jgi:LacI family transcriptional regulator